MKKYFLWILSAALLLSLFVLPASAAAVDPDRLGSITATMTDDGESIPGGTLTLYRVAELDLASSSGFRYVGEYEDCATELDSFGPSEAIELATYTYENDIQGETKVINANGVVKFDSLEPGLYLLIQWKAADGYYHLAPFLVSIPNNEDGEYVYDVTCVPKQEPIPEPTCPSRPTCPSEPTGPSWPTCPSEPEPPTTTEPEPPASQPTRPSEPDQPTQPDEPTEPEQPTKPSEEPTSPSEPSEEPTEPSDEPTRPSEGPTTQPTEPKPSEPQLPQTGQNHWPVPVLAVSGIFLVILGLLLIGKDGKKPHDA